MAYVVRLADGSTEEIDATHIEERAGFAMFLKETVTTLTLERQVSAGLWWWSGTRTEREDRQTRRKDWVTMIRLPLIERMWPSEEEGK